MGIGKLCFLEPVSNQGYICSIKTHFDTIFSSNLPEVH